MLIRFIVKNLLSFHNETEFNLLPGRYHRLQHHIKSEAGIDLLKLNVIYGANGAGKSNLIQALTMLRDFVVDGEIPIKLINNTFKFDKESRKKDIYLGVEFIKNDIPYYYGITLNQGTITEEELLISGLAKSDEKLLFRRTGKVNSNNINLDFSPAVTADKEAALFPPFLKNEILQRNIPVLHYMSNRQNEVFAPFKAVFDWFKYGIELIPAGAVPKGMPILIEMDKKFHEFARHTMNTFGTGIADIHIETIPIDEFFGKENKMQAEQIKEYLQANPREHKSLNYSFGEVNFVLSDDKVEAKTIFFTHTEDKGAERFYPTQESDGTRRLLDYIPALFTLISKDKTYFIDEVERSIHPLLIKELIKKFSHDTHTKGQLIFSTHESNLLDQEIFRPDEIWFVEKNKLGASELYTLSEFKEHHTIDIRKGYLNGRYGAIPFLANLRDLNWEEYA